MQSECVCCCFERDYIAPTDDLAFDIYQDREVAKIIRLLEKKKQGGSEAYDPFIHSLLSHHCLDVVFVLGFDLTHSQSLHHLSTHLYLSSLLVHSFIALSFKMSKPPKSTTSHKVRYPVNAQSSPQSFHLTDASAERRHTLHEEVVSLSS